MVLQRPLIRTFLSHRFGFEREQYETETIKTSTKRHKGGDIYDKESN